MGQHRRIVFRETAMFDPTVYQALVSDEVGTFGHDSTYNVIEVGDDLNEDFPALCNALRAGGFSYSIYRQRKDDGDHTHWKFSASGKPEEHLEHDSPINFIRNVKK